jgi:hypothetical protein
MIRYLLMLRLSSVFHLTGGEVSSRTEVESLCVKEGNAHDAFERIRNAHS